jgi:hypothetical protein
MPAQPNDLAQARTEAALLLRLDPSNLSPSDVLRCDLIASLRLVVDDASATVLNGRGPDLSRLIVATETLIRLLPQATSEPVDRREGGPNDPREHMWRTYLGMRRRGELDETSYDGQRHRIAELEAKVAELEAAPAAPATAVPPAPPAPVGGNVVRLSPPAPAGAPAPAAPPSKPFVNGLSDVPQHVRDTRPPNEAWRNFVKIDWQG